MKKDKKLKKEILRSMNNDEIREELESIKILMTNLDLELTKEYGDWRNMLFFDEQLKITKYHYMASRKKIFEEIIERYL